MTTERKIMITVNSLFASIVLVLVTLVLTAPGKPLRPVPAEELKRADGKSDRTCMVAIEGVVYEIRGSLYWQNGKHLPSEGLAYCGEDLTDVLPKSPHGTRVLKLIDKIGPLVD